MERIGTIRILADHGQMSTGWTMDTKTDDHGWGASTYELEQSWLEQISLLETLSEEQGICVDATD